MRRNKDPGNFWENTHALVEKAYMCGALWNNNRHGSEMLRIARNEPLKTFGKGFNQDIRNRTFSSMPGAFTCDMRSPKSVRDLAVVESP